MSEGSMIFIFFAAFLGGMSCMWWMGKQGMIFNKREWAKARAEINEWKDNERENYRRRVQSWHDDLVYREKKIEKFDARLRKLQKQRWINDAKLDFMEQASVKEPTQYELDGTPIEPEWIV